MCTHMEGNSAWEGPSQWDDWSRLVGPGAYKIMGLTSRTSLVAQTVKHLPAVQETRV